MKSDSNISDLVLREIHLPDSILWWPFAPGWWLLIFLCFAIVLLFILYKKSLYSRLLKNSIRQELAHYKNEYILSGDKSSYIKQLSALLRRVSLYVFKQDNIAALEGEQWLVFLNKNCPQNRALFTENIAEIFIYGPYQQEINYDLSSVYDLVSIWIMFNIKKISRFS